jgi:hypothetical protein
MSKTAGARPVTSRERYAHIAGYKVPRVAGPMSEAFPKAAIDVPPTRAAVQGRQHAFADIET